MKEKSLFFLSLLAILPVLDSCRSIFYPANNTPMPLFKNEGDMFFEASTDFRGYYDVNYGWVTDPDKTGPLGIYFGLAGSKQDYSKNDTSNGINSSRNCRSTSQIVNIGAGYYLDQESSQNIRLEGFLDLSLGGYNNKTIGDSLYLKGGFIRIGGLLNFGYTTSDNKMSFAYSVRPNRLYFLNNSVKGYNFWKENSDQLYYRDHYDMLVHGFMFRYGFRNFKLQAQANLSHGFYQGSVMNAIPKYNAGFSLGLFIDFNLFGMNRDQGKN